VRLNINLPKKLNINLTKLSLVLNVSCLLLAIYALYIAKVNNQVYTVGINRLTDSFTQHLEKSTLTPKQRAEYMLNFAENVEKSLRAFNEKGMTVLMAAKMLPMLLVQKFKRL
jgi:hypothetical protein